MYMSFSDFYWGEGQKEPRERRGSSTSESLSTETGWQRRRRRIEQLTDKYRRENERFRKPCPCCGTLVKPELLGQHYEAYHPSVVQ